MRHSTRAAIAATFLAVGTGAGAHASADISFAGLDLSVPDSGAKFDDFFFGKPIAGGTSFTASFPYTITLHADGAPALRSWSACVPLPGSDCGPAPTGFEQVEFEFGFQQTKEASPFTSYQFTGLPAQNLLIDKLGTVSFSGTFSITETVTPFGFFDNLDYLVVWGATWVDSNGKSPAVPEPSRSVLILLGLGGLSARRWQARQSGSSNESPRG